MRSIQGTSTLSLTDVPIFLKIKKHRPSKEFNQETAKKILAETKRMIKWLKQQLKSDA